LRKAAEVGRIIGAAEGRKRGGSSKPTRSAHSRYAAVVKQYNTIEAAQSYAEAYQGRDSTARFYRSRMELVSQLLDSVPGGDLLDVGCGPGMMVRMLLDSRPGDFSITAIDQSESMIRVCAERAGGDSRAKAIVGQAEHMPLRSSNFDVVLALGVLEYSEIEQSLSEIARVTRPEGIVLMSMLNPCSPSRFVEWHIYPVVKWILRVMETMAAVPRARRHGSTTESGIQAYRERAFRAMSVAAGLRIVDSLGFDITYVVPPLDRISRRWPRDWQSHLDRTISRDWRRRLGSAYMLVARKDEAAKGVGR
jgi:ubiquinone/menaquinone biosynthesis C-methylase UbiE